MITTSKTPWWWHVRCAETCCRIDNVCRTCSVNMKLVLQTDYHMVHGTYNVKIRLNLLIAYRRAHMSAVRLYYYYYYYHHHHHHIFHGVGPLVVPFRSHVSRSLFKSLPWYLLPVGEYCFITLGNLFRGILFACCIQLLLYSSNLSKIGVIFNSFAVYALVL